MSQRKQPITRTAALKALTPADLFEAAVALSSHIQDITKMLADGAPADPWQSRLDAARRAHEHITTARVAV